MGALARVVGPQCAGYAFPISINAPFFQGAVMVVPAIFLAIGAGQKAKAERRAKVAANAAAQP
jgi:hypothetical protein